MHVKDLTAGEPVGSGEGEIEFAATLAADGEAGAWVVELEGKCWGDTKRYLRQAVELLAPLVEE